MKIYKITEASDYLGVSINTLKTLANNGKIKSFKTTGEHRRFRQEDLDAYMGVEKEKQEKLTVIYARCSTAKQKGLKMSLTNLMEFKKEVNMIDPRVIFDYVDNFDESENWGNLTKVNPLLILTLNYIRKYTNTPIHINCAYENGGHTTTSQHYKGNAVDFYLGSSLKFYDQINLMERTLVDLNLDDRVGFGIYPYWNIPGFHLDIRGEKARWGRNSKGEYVGYDVIKYEII